MHRADSIVSERQDLIKEKIHIRKALNMKGYPDWFDFSCMVEIEVDNVYNLTLRTIMKTQNGNRSVQVLNK